MDDVKMCLNFRQIFTIYIHTIYFEHILRPTLWFDLFSVLTTRLGMFVIG